MNITLDLAALFGACFALLTAFIWPVFLLVILVVYRKKVPDLVQGLTRRVTKLEFAGISLDLAVAEQFTPEWVSATTALDLRHKATSAEITDSTAGTFTTQLQQEGTADFATVDLGAGQEWLTTRLFIMAIIFARMKGIQYFVFFETSSDVKKSYIGWAESNKIRWALAKRYPWLEQKYSDAYSAVMNQTTNVIVSNQGRVGYSYDPKNPAASINLLRQFLQRVQNPLPVPPNVNEWVSLESTPVMYEQATWVSPALVKELLGSDLHRANVRLADVNSRSTTEQLKLYLAMSERFVGIVDDSRQFEYMVDRSDLLEQLAKNVASKSEDRS